MKSQEVSLEYGRKLVIGCVAAGIVALFLTSFIYRSAPQSTSTHGAERASAERMKKVQSLMEHLQHSPDDVEVIESVAEEFAELGDWAKAEAFWRKSVAIQPDNASYRFHIAVALLQQEKFQDAIPELEKSLTLEPGNAVAHYYLGMIYKTTLNAPEKAREHLKAVLALNPGHKQLLEDAQKELESL